MNCAFAPKIVKNQSELSMNLDGGRYPITALVPGNGPMSGARSLQPDREPPSPISENHDWRPRRGGVATRSTLGLTIARSARGHVDGRPTLRRHGELHLLAADGDGVRHRASGVIHDGHQAAVGVLPGQRLSAGRSDDGRPRLPNPKSNRRALLMAARFPPGPKAISRFWGRRASAHDAPGFSSASSHPWPPSLIYGGRRNHGARALSTLKGGAR